MSDRATTTTDETAEAAIVPSPPIPRQRSRWRTAAVALCAVALAAIGCGYATYRTAVAGMPALSTIEAEQLSTVVVDRDGRLLRPFTNAEGRWRLPIEPKDVDQRYLKMLLAFEDQRFYRHGGVDVPAVLRAAAQGLAYGRLVSGASTLTMQTARLLDQRHERTGLGKIRQMSRALELEQRYSKTDILRFYLRLAPFGGNIEGVRAATLAYFGKEPRRLSIGEAALLVALPQAPEARRPDQDWQAAERARNRVLDRVAAAGVITPVEAEHAKREAVPRGRIAFPQHAPHLSEQELARTPAEPVIRLTLERRLQAGLEGLAAKHARLVGEKISVAIVVADHDSGDILAHVGSAGYLDAARRGAVDMVTAVRSPGSTLKPFIYGLGFEAGLAHPETLIEDRPVRFGDYAPKNFDEDYHGTISIREALAQSLNIPAVRVLARVGPGKLVGRFRRAGVAAKFPDGAEPTLAMALGGTGLTLVELTQLYAALARGGDAIALHARADARAKALAATRVAALVNARRLMSPLAAWYVTDVLKDAPPPADAKGGRFAYKTGTSYGYRDALAVGFDGRHVIAVWVGRADGESVPGMMGRTAAAPILFDAFQRVSEKRAALRSPPTDAITGNAGTLPPPLKRWREPGEEIAAGPFLAPPVLISFPPDRAEIDIAAGSADAEPLILKAEGGALPLTWLVDDAPIASDPHQRDVMWQPSGPGFSKVTVIDAKGVTDRVTVRLR